MLRLAGKLIATGLLLWPALALAQDEASLRAADAEQRRLVFESDVAGLKALVHPDMLINGPSGRIVDREQFFESVRTGAIAKEKFERVPERVSIVGGVGTVMGHEIVVAKPGSRDHAVFADRSFERRYTNVFIFLDGRWRFLSRQAAIAPQAAPH
ncbi:nuclear transport factor 2 family protein [Caulobacter hibisci]|uniref:Nuclear transport factor 2 family protein n=1 Tax=Caulobacter hibisci TaxID=2035993 RepID=A0ABS0SVF8_9CAUL|nr:nuclear transport factor 2 family protein [Caulobacter hibisci]MBI1682663.1 nuclear transport factor 2 family protein [Caulobacter hibisci]